MTRKDRDSADAQAVLKLLRSPILTTRESLARGLCATDAERQQQLDGMRRVVDDPQLEKIHTWLHTNLIILDSKAASILSIYSIALAALTIFYAAVGTDGPLSILIISVAGFLVIAWAIVPLASIVYVYWSTTQDFGDPEKLLLDLIRVRDQRTRKVRLSILKGGISLALFFVVLAWDVARHL